MYESNIYPFGRDEHTILAKQEDWEMNKIKRQTVVVCPLSDNKWHASDGEGRATILEILDSSLFETLSVGSVPGTDPFLDLRFFLFYKNPF